MTVTYSWEILPPLKYRDVVNENGELLKDAIFQTYWRKTGADAKGNTGSFDGGTPLSASKVPASNFTSLESLNSETVLGWVKALVIDEYEEHVNEQILAEIEEKANPVEESPELPW